MEHDSSRDQFSPKLLQGQAKAVGVLQPQTQLSSSSSDLASSFRIPELLELSRHDSWLQNQRR